jgi:2-polyprenyl-3-methyl-5-hydroxy-6-metoxy-1,4-benzoquinol methylase
MNKSIVNRKQYWDQIYSAQPPEKMGWYQEIPEISLSFMGAAGISTGASVIDIGGGESSLTEQLIHRGISDLSVLDVSDKAIQRSRERLGIQAPCVDWINADVLEFQPNRYYDIWHDRACFHFLNSDEEISRYVDIAKGAVSLGGHLVLGAFSHQGPAKCSGLEVNRYDLDSMKQTFSGFELQAYEYLDHKTPAGNSQNYIFCLFKAEP